MPARRARPLALALVPVLSMGLAAHSPLPAQGTRGLAQAAAAISAGDDLHYRQRPRAALEAFERILATDPNHYGALWRAAREAVTLAMLTGDEEARAALYGEAERYALLAAQARPGSVEGHHWLAVAYGRRADAEGPGTLIELAGRIRHGALAVLATDSLHDGAHGVMGRWNASVMRLSGVTRYLARELLGADVFERASWEGAERHLRRAVELDPGVLAHHLALARVLIDLDRRDEARRQLREVLERPARHPLDPTLKQRAQELLRDL